ncbi:tetratricopeptide repeat protein [Actinoplanes sp. NBC_00393]|uniref:tetratricopeptide repeat protein n=1 Tax=Actinoplanes sp. NBC_00393 TaxID=2975953 RepID=UPI002E1E02FD
MLPEKRTRRVSTPLVIGSLPVVVAAGSWLTNVLTDGWNPWLFGVLAVVVAVSSGLTVAAERAAGNLRAVHREPVPVPAPIWLDVPPRNRHFTGREDLLAGLDLRTADSADPAVTALVPHALYGLGGVGKTHLAIEFTHRHRSAFDLVAWMPAEQEAVLRSAWLNLARTMGIAESETLERTVDMVRDGLRRGIPFRRWLVVFDNAEDPATLRPYLPEAAQPHSTGRVLITSRNRTWHSLADTVEVEVLHRDESVALLRKRNPGVTDTDAGRLAEQLGDLPLALRTVLADPVRLDRAMTQVGRLSLARLDKARGTIQVHRLVQAVVRARLQPNDQAELRSAAQRLLAAAVSSAPWVDEPASWPAHGLITAHLRSAGCVESADRHIQELVLQHIRYLEVRGDSASAHRLAREAWNRWGELLGPDHQLTLRAALSLVEAARTLGEQFTVTPLLEETLSRARRALGETHRVTLKIANSYGGSLRLAGDFRRAYRLDLVTLDRACDTSGETDVFTIRVRNNLAADLRHLGRFADAFALDEENVALRELVLGPHHPDTLYSRWMCGLDRYYLGAHERAHEMIRTVLPEIEADLGAFHVRALQTSAYVTHPSEPAGALSLAVRTLELHRQVYGKEHPATVAALVATAVVERRNNEFGAAARHGREAVALARHVLGADHWITLAAEAGCALDEATTGDLPNAYQLLRAVYERSVAISGAGHPHTLARAANLVRVGRRAFDGAMEQRLRAEIGAAMGLEPGDVVPLLARRRGRGWVECPVEVPPY